jgi:hypothetical protein
MGETRRCDGWLRLKSVHLTGGFREIAKGVAESIPLRVLKLVAEERRVLLRVRLRPT